MTGAIYFMLTMFMKHKLLTGEKALNSYNIICKKGLDAIAQNRYI